MKKPGKPKSPRRLVRVHLMLAKDTIERLRYAAEAERRSVSAQADRYLCKAMEEVQA